MPRSPRWRAWAALFIATVCLTAFYGWAYGDCLGRFFYLDDFWELKEVSNIHIGSPADLLQFFRPVPYFLLYRPISTLLYFYTLHGLFGLDPTGYHATQMAFHILNALLVYAIAAKLLESRPLALAVALVYALAPGHAIAVYWVALFTMTGTAFFYFLGLWAWFGLKPHWRVPVTLVLFVLTLLAGEHAVSFPIVLTLAALLLERRRSWVRVARQQAAFYLIAGSYVAAKLYYLHYILPGKNPFAQGIAEAAYGMDFGPRLVLRHLGRYLGFAVGLFYQLVGSDTWALVIGLLVAAAAAGATLGVTTGRWEARPLRVATFGVDLFVVALAPVLFLRAHVEPYYVGIAGLGIALAVVGFTQMLPRAAGVATCLLVAGLLGVHAWSTAALARQTLQFNLFTGGSELAAEWLATLAALEPLPVEEIVVPEDGTTNMVFNDGEAHKIFLCARYRVRTSATINREQPDAGRVIVRAPRIEPPPPARWHRSWPWIRQRCSD